MALTAERDDGEVACNRATEAKASRRRRLAHGVDAKKLPAVDGHLIHVLREVRSEDRALIFDKKAAKS